MDSLIVEVVTEEGRKGGWFVKELGFLTTAVGLVKSYDELLRDMARKGGSEGEGLVFVGRSPGPSSRDELLFSQLQRELADTEERFSAKLVLLDKYFVQPLAREISTSSSSPGQHRKIRIPRLSQWDFDHTFAKIPPLLASQSLFNQRLQAALDGDQDLFQCMHEQFSKRSRPLIDYVENYSDCLKVIDKLQRVHPQFSTFIKEQQGQIEEEQGQFIDLQSLLIEPVQRIARYSLLAEKMLACLYGPERATLSDIIKILNRMGSLHDEPSSRLLQCMMNLPRTVQGFPSDLISRQMLLDVVDMVQRDKDGVEKRCSLVILLTAIVVTIRTGPTDGPSLIGTRPHPSFAGPSSSSPIISPNKVREGLRFSHVVHYDHATFYATDRAGRVAQVEHREEYEEWIFDSRQCRDKVLQHAWHAQATECARKILYQGPLHQMQVNEDSRSTILWFVLRSRSTTNLPCHCSVTFGSSHRFAEDATETTLVLDRQPHGIIVKTQQKVNGQAMIFTQFLQLAQLWTFLAETGRQRILELEKRRRAKIRPAMSSRLSKSWRSWVAPSSPRSEEAPVLSTSPRKTTMA